MASTILIPIGFSIRGISSKNIYYKLPLRDFWLFFLISILFILFFENNTNNTRAIYVWNRDHGIMQVKKSGYVVVVSHNYIADGWYPWNENSFSVGVYGGLLTIENSYNLLECPWLIHSKFGFKRSQWIKFETGFS